MRKIIKAIGGPSVIVRTFKQIGVDYPATPAMRGGGCGGRAILS